MDVQFGSMTKFRKYTRIVDISSQEGIQGPNKEMHTSPSKYSNSLGLEKIRIHKQDLRVHNSIFILERRLASYFEKYGYQMQ